MEIRKRPLPANDLLLRAARGEPTWRTPVWFMRQAGRFDPLYREIRLRDDLPLEDLFRNPDVCAEISMLPRRFGVDAIILFQDILTPLAPAGRKFAFRPAPILENPLRGPEEIDTIHRFDVAEELGFVSRAMELTGEALSGELPLLGFAGAPLTLAFFLIEGESPHPGSSRTRLLMRDAPASLHRLLERLAEMTADYLALQIEAGADAVQLFESAANLVSRREYEEFAHPYQVRVLAELGSRVPAILYVKEQPFIELMAESGADVLSIGTCVGLAEARARAGRRVALQGNLDQRLLLEGSFEQIDEAVRQCVAEGGRKGHILNLANGLDKDTPVENVCRVVETARKASAAADPEPVNAG